MSGKRNRHYFGPNSDKFKYVIFCKEYHEGNAKLLTQRKSALPNQCRYFTLLIRQSPCRAYCKAQGHNWQLQLNQTGLAICVQVFDWSTTVKKVVVIAENTMFEMTAAGLDGHRETTTTLMNRSCNDSFATTKYCRSLFLRDTVQNTTNKNKKLSCRRETARRFVSLNI